MSETWRQRDDVEDGLAQLKSDLPKKAVRQTQISGNR